MDGPDSTRGASTRNTAVVTASLVVLLLVWEVLVRGLNVPHFILPTPVAIIVELYKNIRSGFLLPHIGVTVFEILVGFLLGTAAGVGLAAAVHRSRLLDIVLRPYIVAFQATPKVAIAPLFVMWFGFGLTSKVLIVALICFFPVFVNTLAGLQSLSPKVLDLMNSYSASRWQIFWKARVPNALPYLFAGLEIGITLSLIGALVGEFVGSSGGLGYLLILWQTQLETAGVFAVIVVLVGLGLLLYSVMAAAGRRLAFWSGRV